MQNIDIILYTTAATASAAAVAAVVSDKFQNIAASGVALLAGLTPWLFFLMWPIDLPASTALSLFILLGSGPLFLIACFLYGVGRRTPRRAIAVGASLLGMFASGWVSVVLCELVAGRH